MSFTLERDAWGRLVLKDEARTIAVEPVRAFPISRPREGIALMDEHGREAEWIPSLDELPAGVREALEEELRRREFMPRIRRVVRVSGNVEPTTWDVETDRGPTRFVLNGEDDVRRLSEDRALVIDAHGIRYLIPDLAALDAHSARLLERYL
jgi:hypothetical protein